MYYSIRLRPNAILAIAVFAILSSLVTSRMVLANTNPVPGSVLGTTRYVATTGSDTGNCSSQASPCLTITYAIAQASSGDTIEIAAGTYVEPGIVVNKDLILDGAGVDSTIIRGTPEGNNVGSARVFEINSGVVATIETLTIRSVFTNSEGAGIYNQGTLTLNNSLITEAVTNFKGGGIFNQGTLAINNSTIHFNHALLNGGGIYNEGALTITNSTLSNSTAENGGGIYTTNTLTIDNSTITNNRTTGDGGGVFHASVNPVAINYSTISLNLSDSENGGFGDGSGEGGGLYIDSGTAALTLKSSIIAGNLRGLVSTYATSDCSGALTSQGYNITGSNTGCSLSGTGDVSRDPAQVMGRVINYPNDNGGPTQTQAVVVNDNNPAYNAIPAGTNDCGAAPFDKDQRGEPRPFGSNCDIGAVEAQSNPAPGFYSSPVQGGTINIGETTVAHSVTALLTIYGTGALQLDVTSYSITGNDASVFSLNTNAPPFSIPYGSSGIEISVQCLSVTTGTKTATLEIIHNAAGSPATYPLTCQVNTNAPSDFDGDGKTDAAKFMADPGVVWWYKSSTSSWDGVYLGSDTYDYVLGSDFDGDGITDPAKFYATTGVVWWYKSATSSWDGVYLGNDSYQFISGSDFDGDGKTDPAKLYTTTGVLWWYSSVTSSWDGLYLGTDAYAYQTGSDFDGDGTTDPAKFYSGTNTVWWYASTTSTWESFYLDTGTFTYVTGSDFDGDGETDPAKFMPNGVVWWYASTTSTWEALYLGSDSFEYIMGVDFDGDGKTDPAKFYSNPGTVWWYPSNGGGWDGAYLGNDATIFAAGIK